MATILTFQWDEHCEKMEDVERIKEMSDASVNDYR